MDDQALLSFGLWIKRRRKALDLTQDALAVLVGCSKDLIVKIEGDARRPSREIAALLATQLQLAPEEREDFIRCARAELAPDRLPPPTRSMPRAAFSARPSADPPAAICRPSSPRSSAGRRAGGSAGCASARHQESEVAARIYNAAARLQKNLWGSPQDIELLERSLALARQYEDRPLQAEVLRHLGEERSMHDFHAAMQVFEESCGSAANSTTPNRRAGRRSISARRADARRSR